MGDRNGRDEITGVHDIRKMRDQRLPEIETRLEDFESFEKKVKRWGIVGSLVAAGFGAAIWLMVHFAPASLEERVRIIETGQAQIMGRLDELLWRIK